MGGIRSAGDLVLRMQLAKSMRLPEAKKYVAEKLGVSVEDLADCVVMRDIRQELDIGYAMRRTAARKALKQSSISPDFWIFRSSR